MKKKLIKYSIYFIGGIFVLVIVFFATTELTSKPAFCSTCHFMQPYVDGWKKSTHSNVTCTDCHFPPGFKSKMQGKFTAVSMVVNYITGIYKKSKPWAEISDASCLRPGCHVERLLDGRVLYKEGIIFDHAPHVTKLRRGKQLRCTSCHSQIVQGQHISVTESTCFLCHFKNQPEDVKIDDCTWCHTAPIASLNIEQVKYDHSFAIVKQIDCKKCHGQMQVGDGAVPVERCHSCHAELEHIEKYDDVEFIHQNHVTDHKVECQNCHLVIQHKSVSKSADIMPDCQSCHQNSHIAQLDLFSGTGGKRVPSHPNPMFEDGLNCQACHLFHEYNGNSQTLGETVKANYISCEICHGEGYSKILNQWERLMQEKMEFIGKSITLIKDEVAKSTVAEPSFRHAKTILEEAEFNYELVKNGNVVHNVAYSDELLLSSFKSLKKVIKTIKSSTELPNISIYSKLVPSECKNCHYGQEEIDVEAYGIVFSHDIHIVKNHLKCSKCHSNMNRHGELIMSRKECLSCHHKPEEENCAKCHEVQAQIYEGIPEFADEETPDIMYESDVDCRSCHERKEHTIWRATGETCVECHDDEYQEILEEWQEDTEAALDGINSIIINLDYNQLDQEAKLTVDQITKAVNLIAVDKSLSAHNNELISEKLAEFQQLLIGFTN